MLFEENNLIDDGKKTILMIEANLRDLKADYQKALTDYTELQKLGGDAYEKLEPEYLSLLAKFKKSIDKSMSLWDQTIANVEKLKTSKGIKAKYFLTGIIWTAERLSLEQDKKEKLIEDAKKLI